MHAFVTGATGFCGRHLVAALIARGHRVTALVRPTSNRKGLVDLGVGFVEGDLLEPASYRAAVGEADVVFHLAAQLRTPWRDDFMTTNGDATHCCRCLVRPWCRAAWRGEGPPPLDVPR